jgi:hypothetical protein
MFEKKRLAAVLTMAVLLLVAMGLPAQAVKVTFQPKLPARGRSTWLENSTAGAIRQIS